MPAREREPSCLARTFFLTAVTFLSRIIVDDLRSVRVRYAARPEAVTPFIARDIPALTKLNGTMMKVGEKGQHRDALYQSFAIISARISDLRLFLGEQKRKNYRNNYR